MLAASLRRAGHRAVPAMGLSRPLHSCTKCIPTSLLHTTFWNSASGQHDKDIRWPRASPLCWQQRRAYRLLPSQTLSLAQAHIPALFSKGSTAGEQDVIVATSVKEVEKAVGALDSFPLVLQADVLDALPNEGVFHFETREAEGKSSSRPAARGAKQLVWNGQEAKLFAEIWLGKGATFQSATPPFVRKEVPAIIVRRAPATDGSASATHVRFIVAADRKPHSAGNGFFFGPTLTVMSCPPSLATGTAQQLDPASSMSVGIDVSSLMHAKKIGESSSLFDETTKAKGKEADETLSKVAATTAQIAWAEQGIHLKLNESVQEDFVGVAKQSIETFWRGDGDRFVFDVLMPAHSKGYLQLVSAEMQFDDDGLARQKALSAMRQDGSVMWGPSSSSSLQMTPVNSVMHELHALEELAEKSGMVYRKHRGGNIGLFGYGAGMGMGTVDGLIEEGGRPANFFDGGGGASIANSKEAMRILSKDPDVKCILVNIFGGITRSDLVSQGIIEAYRDYDIKVPLVARFRGNKAQEAQSTLRESKLNVELFDDYRPAAKRATEIASAASAGSGSATKSTSSSVGAAKTSSQQRRGQQKRSYTTAANPGGPHVQALVGYAFAGKPRQPESSAEAREKSGAAALPRQGFPSSSPIGMWVDDMLSNGDAGEDALAVASMKGEGDWILAVADGVGGWSENGIDPALFSQALMYHASEYARHFFACPQRLEAEDLDAGDQQSPPASPLNTPPPSPSPPGAAGAKTPAADAGTPVDILQYAYRQTLAQKEVPAGSATACIVTFDSSKGMLRSANLGDSGFIVLRPDVSPKKTVAASQSQDHAVSEDAEENASQGGLHVVHYQSKPQTHGFNTPHQLSKLPPEYRFENSIDSQPHHAATWEARVRDGDLVLLATDGFWDNVSTAEVLQLVAFIRQKHRSAWVEQVRQGSAANDDVAEERDLASVLAHNLLSYARMCQASTTKTSPFERDAARHGIHYPGGKVDDVAILVSLIVER